MKSTMPKNNINRDRGFIRLTTKEVTSNLLEVLKLVLIAGKRIVLEQAESEVGAIIPIHEFDRLSYLEQELKPSQYEPYEEEYYEDERGIHCVCPDEFRDEFDDILNEVSVYNELFGLLPPPKLSGREFDAFVPAAILMNINKFWVPEYLINENHRLLSYHKNAETTEG